MTYHLSDPNTQVRLFADDCLIYRVIESIKDQHKFQKDLTNLAMWGQQWGMHFNTGTCNILTMPNSGKHHPIFYNINGQILQQVPTAKYLGISVHDSLDFSCHVAETVTKANKRLGF